jgi:hypothetical protein
MATVIGICTYFYLNVNVNVNATLRSAVKLPTMYLLTPWSTVFLERLV